MAAVRIPAEERRLETYDEIKAYLASIGIGYERWTSAQQSAESASTEEVLLAYADEIEALKREGDYVTADVIDVKPDTPGLDTMLAKFSREHWHDEDEVRFILEGHGIFHIHPKDHPIVAIEVESGDLIRVPRNAWHWFDLCGDRRIRAIRLFQDTSGWTPHYTESGVDKGYLPACLGLHFIPATL
jgi:1,2-dihydroxy-3-keto-5-methylthiopentene dioxygenase